MLIKLNILFIIILTWLLFVQYPHQYDNPVFKQFWETGHFVLFSGLFFALNQIEKLKQLKLHKLFILTTLLSILIGLATELTQLLFERSFEIKDIFNDLIGAYCGLLLSRINTNNPLKTNALYILGFVCGLIVATHLFFISLINQFHIQVKYPILSDLETTFEIRRWNSSKVALQISSDIKIQGEHSLQANFSPAKYPRFYLEHFSKDWQYFHHLSFSIYNQQKENVEATIVIYDFIHQSTGYPHDDRFNLNVNLKTGWNHFNIPMTQVENSPSNREMDLHSILYFGVWIKNLKQPTTLYFDNLRLENESTN